MGFGVEGCRHFWGGRLHAGSRAPSYVSAAAVAGQGYGAGKRLQPLAEADCDKGLKVKKPADTSDDEV